MKFSVDQFSRGKIMQFVAALAGKIFSERLDFGLIF
jgi:hypothetical protein